MLKQRRKAADQVAEHLFSAEAAIDAALNKTAALAAVLPVARADARLSTLFGQDALERLSETIAAIAQARRGIVETHKQLASVQGQIGLGAVAFGDDGTKPNQAEPFHPHFHTVGDAAA
jgi:hypothetical protein